MTESQIVVSKLYNEHNQKPYLQSNGSIKHPFEELEIQIGNYYKSHEISNPDSLYEIFEKFQLKENKCRKQFEFESCLLLNRNQDYINECTSILIKLKNDIHRTKSPYKDFDSPDFIILNSLENLLLYISRKYAYMLNADNRDFLIRMTSLEPPILSFHLKKAINHNEFEKNYNEFLRGSLVEYRHSAYQFKAIFERMRLEKKINWIGTQNSLKYFIKELIKPENDLVYPVRNKHWKITCEFFLLNGVPLTPKDLKSRSFTKDKKSINRIRNFLSLLPS